MNLLQVMWEKCGNAHFNVEKKQEDRVDPNINWKDELVSTVSKRK